ncbi:MAG TPA: TetR/AcrR family transcriptional regulator [Candidatus Methylomirabilis sp.]|nr:TetR/AcrR family transcriptional regulator [Candidatus Methylomirabilis sp.]
MPRNLSASEVDSFRARLCAVAQHRFATRGADGVSMRQLAEALGCSPMTPYRYFRNKDAILAAVRAAAFDRFATALERAVARARGDVRAAGQAVSRAYIRFAARQPEGYRLMFDLSQPHPQRYPELVRASARARRTMTASIEALVAAGIFTGKPALLGLVFWAALHGLVMLRLAGKLPARPGFRTIQGEVMRVLVGGARGGVATAPSRARRRRAAPRRRRSP